MISNRILARVSRFTTFQTPKLWGRSCLVRPNRCLRTWKNSCRVRETTAWLSFRLARTFVFMMTTFKCWQRLSPNYLRKWFLSTVQVRSILCSSIFDADTIYFHLQLPIAECRESRERLKRIKDYGLNMVPVYPISRRSWENYGGLLVARSRARLYQLRSR